MFLSCPMVLHDVKCFRPHRRTLRCCKEGPYTLCAVQCCMAMGSLQCCPKGRTKGFHASVPVFQMSRVCMRVHASQRVCVRARTRKRVRVRVCTASTS